MNNRTTIMIAMVAVMMMMGPLAGAYQSGGPVGGDLNNSNTSVSINSTYLVGGDVSNVTYERMTVGLNFSLNFAVNVTNVTLDFGNLGVDFWQVITNNTIASNANITNVSYAGGWGNLSTNNMVRINTNDTIEFYNATGDPVNCTTDLNNVSNGSILYFSINNVTMPSVGSTTDLFINVSATGGEAGNTVNWTHVYLNITNDDAAPTLTSLNMTTLGDTAVVSGPGGIPEVWNVTSNATNPSIAFNLNDTLSGVKNGTIKVYIDDASDVLLNDTINEGNVTMDGRNASISLLSSGYFAANAPGNLTAGETHTLNVSVTDNSTNELLYYTAETFYIPRIVMGANRTTDITADGSDAVRMTIHLLKPDGSIDTSTGNVRLSSSADLKFDGGSNLLYKANNGGNVIVNVTFNTSGTHTITAQFNGTTNDIKIATVAVVANVTASPARSTLVANGTDSCNITLQAVDAGGSPVLRSGYTVTITAVSSVSGSSPNIDTTSKTTDANGRYNYTLTASTNEGEVITITPAIQLADGVTWIEGAPIQVTFVAGGAAKMKLYSSQGTGNNGVSNPTNLTVTGIVAGNTTTFTANITDANNHPLSGQTVTFTRISGTGTPITASDTTDANGNASVDFTTDLTKGVNVSIINVTVAENATLFNYIDVSTTNGTADHLVLTASPSGLPADGESNSTLVARVVDINGNSVHGYAGAANITFVMSPTTLGNLSASYGLTNATGYSEVNFTASTTTGTVTITATANITLPGGNSTTVDIALGTPNTIVLSANRTNIPTDGSLNASVTAALYEDTMPIGMQGVNISFQLTNGTLYETANTSNNGTSITVQTNNTGVAAVTVSGSGATETVTLVVVSPDYPVIDAVTKGFTFTGSAVSFKLTNTTPTAPNATTGISESTLTVQLYDALDNEVGAVPGKLVTFAKTAGTISASTGTTNVTTGALSVTLSANTTTGAVTSTVTAYISSMTAQSVTVTFPALEVLSVDTIDVTPAGPLSMNKTDTKNFTAICYNDTTGTTPLTGITVTWESSNTTVGTIDASGLFTALANGTTTITATAQGVTSDPVTVTVGAAALSNMTVAATPSTINASEETSITINVTDASTGAAIDGASVALEFNGTEIANCTTSAGECTVTVNVTETGMINVTVTASGYNAGSDTVTVGAVCVKGELDGVSGITANDALTVVTGCIFNAYCCSKCWCNK